MLEFRSLFVKFSGLWDGYDLVLSPVPIGEEVLAQKRISIAEKEIQKIWPKKLDETILVPYNPRLALDERIVIARRTNLALSSAYLKLAKRLANTLKDTSSEAASEILKEIKRNNWVVAADKLDLLISRYPDFEDSLGPIALMLQSYVYNHAATPIFEKLAKLHDSQISFIAAAHYNFMKRRREAEGIIRSLLNKTPNDTQLWTLFLINLFESVPRSEAKSPTKKLLAPIEMAVKSVTPSSDFLYLAAWLASGSVDGNVKAQEYYRLAYDLDPTDYRGLARYAKFAWRNINDINLARKLYEEAFASGKLTANELRSFAQFLQIKRLDPRRAFKLRRQADALDKKDKKNKKAKKPTR